MRPGESLLGCLPEPPHRLHVVLPHSLAVGVHDAQVVLRPGLSLLSRLPVPPHRLHVVLPHSPAFRVHEAQVVLTPGVSLLGRLPVPPHRLHIVLPHSPAVLVHAAQSVLSRSVSLLGGLAKPLNVLILGKSGLNPGQDDHGREQKYQVPSESVSVGHDSPQTLSKSSSLRQKADISTVRLKLAQYQLLTGCGAFLLQEGSFKRCTGDVVDLLE